MSLSSGLESVPNCLSPGVERSVFPFKDLTNWFLSFDDNESLVMSRLFWKSKVSSGIFLLKTGAISLIKWWNSWLVVDFSDNNWIAKI